MRRIMLFSLMLSLMAGVMLIPSRAEVSGKSGRLIGAQQQVAPAPIRLLRFAESPPVRNLPAAKTLADSSLLQQNNEAEEINELNTERVRTPNWSLPSIDATLPGKGAVRTQGITPSALPSPSLTFEGIDAADEGNSVAPPDTEGDVGPNDYVQGVNNLVRIFDKNGNPRGPAFKQSSLFAAVGGLGSQVDHGDPIILYDRMADRWLISQFSFTSSVSPPYFESIAISKSGDPTGAYFLYLFQLPGNEFPDYPKIGVWPDGYYMTSNQFLNGGSFDGAGAFAFDRNKMLVGDPTASGAYFNLNLTSHPEGIFGMLPSDHDGLLPPPSGAPNVFTYFTNTQFGDPADGLRLFNFHFDPVTPANSTFTERAESTYNAPLALAAFDARVPGGRAHVKQPPPAGNNTTDRLDSVGERMMYRLQYFNRNGQESLVSNFTVNVSGVTPNSGTNYQAGFRYFELKKTTPGGLYSVNEQATFAPGSGNAATGPNRWMGSAAIDNQENLAVGYSISSTSIFPSLNYAGRLSTDPPNGLAQGEATLFAGTGVQRSTGNRWGDYSTLDVDPSDDCSFWFTSEYYTTTNTTFNWRTRIGKFKFASCTPPAQGTLSGTITECDSGIPLDNAMVTATGGPSTGYSSTTMTNGTYSLNLAPGSYMITVTSIPHHCQAAGPFNVTITNGQTTTLNTCLIGTANTAFVSAAISGGNGNGIIDKDECNSLSISVVSTGCLTASHVLGTLATSTPGVTITQAHSNYPDMKVGSTGANVIPFSVSTSPTFVCGTTIMFTLTMAYNGGSNVLSFSLPSCGCSTTTVNGSITGSDSTAVSRLGRNALASSCSLIKACPGAIDTTFTANTTRFFHLHTFTNGPTAACATITTTASCSSATNPIIPVAYLGSFNPSNLCTNYLGDPGGSPAPTNSFQVNVPANGTLVVCVQEVNHGQGGCSGYTVSVSGLICNTDAGVQCPVFNTCLQDDTTGNILMWNSTTGDYQYIACGAGGSTMTGKGTVSMVNGFKNLSDSKPDRRITAGFSTASLTGRANLTLILSNGIFQTIVINQTNPNATCVCH